MILITGATGHLGAAVINHLLKITPAENIVAFARDAHKASHWKDKGVAVRIGSFDDTASLEQAMQGVDKLLLVSGTDANRFQQHKNVVDVAVKSGVKQIVYTGIAMKDVHSSAIKDLMNSHFETEDYIKKSGLSYTFLRNTLYADGIPMFAGEKVFETGIALPAGDGKISYALRREMGEAAANVLVQSGHDNKTYDITGSDLYSYADVAEALSELSGKPIAYTNVDAGDYAAQLNQAGLPDFVKYLLTGFSEDTKNGQFELVSKDLEVLLDRKPASLQESLKEVYSL